MDLARAPLPGVHPHPEQTAGRTERKSTHCGLSFSRPGSLPSFSKRPQLSAGVLLQPTGLGVQCVPESLPRTGALFSQHLDEAGVFLLALGTRVRVWRQSAWDRTAVRTSWVGSPRLFPPLLPAVPALREDAVKRSLRWQAALRSLRSGLGSDLGQRSPPQLSRSVQGRRVDVGSQQPGRGGA